MNKFLTDTRVRFAEKYNFELIAPLHFQYHDGETLRVIIVPTGFKTDLATTPRLLWPIFPPHGSYASSAIVHDFLCENGLHTKKEADLIFLYAMTSLGIPKAKRTVMYHAVRIFGKGNF